MRLKQKITCDINCFYCFTNDWFQLFFNYSTNKKIFGLKGGSHGH